MKKIFLCLLMALALAGCNHATKKTELKSGLWRAVLKIDTVNNITEVPFNFRVIAVGKDSFHVAFMNAAERIIATEVKVKNDSVFIRMPVFDSEFKAKIEGDTLSGYWYNYARKNYRLPFFAYYNVKDRFIAKEKSKYAVTGRWSATIDPGTADAENTVGEFVQINDTLTGTFLSESGDYRYLQGVVDGKQMNLSTFDGTHVWLFTANITSDSTMEGMFYKGKHAKQTWKAVKNEKAKLRNCDSLAHLKKAAKQFTFKLTDLNTNKTIDQSDSRFKNKVVIVQIMGTWCPNCLDESTLFMEFYDKYKMNGLEIIGADFETTDNMDKVKSNMQRMINYRKMTYPIYFGGKTGEKNIYSVFPELENFGGYPTSIFIDREGTVRKIHTGFSGPGTGSHYAELKNELNTFIFSLLKER